MKKQEVQEIINRVELSKTDEGYYNHDVMPYIPKLLSIAKDYIEKVNILESFKTMTLDDLALYQYYVKYGRENDNIQ